MKALRGVNLGGWLVVERWMTPSVFEGSIAIDEKTLSEQYQARIKQHHERFIQEEDFAWMAKHGLEAIRIPIGYWIFGDEAPFAGSINKLDFAFEMARKYHLQVVISLHGALGSQNGKRHSGQESKPRWHWDGQAQLKTLGLIEKLAKRYASHPQLWGIEVMNEPAGGPLKNLVLKKYYKATYKIIREQCGESTEIILSDNYRPERWKRFMKPPKYKNVVLDTHLYQCYSPKDKRASISAHLQKAAGQKAKISQWQRHKPVIVGEWGLGMGPHTLDGYDKLQQRELFRKYAAAQIKSYNTALAWFFWSYKMEHQNNWNFRRLVESGVIDL